MKVQITKDTKKWLTLAQAPYAHQIVEWCKDDMSAKEAASIAANVTAGFYNDYAREVLKASAEICKDNRTPYDYFGEGCEHLNVWVTATVETGNGFMKIGCLLSDIHGVGDDETRKELFNNSYIRYYKEVQ